MEKSQNHIDIVCKMSVNHERYTYKYQDQNYFFCSASCKDKFILDPFLYISDAHKKLEPISDALEYLCPMHPQIVENKPGDCPLCGMPLEAVGASAEEQEKTEQQKKYREFYISLCFSLPLFVLHLLKIMTVPIDDLVPPSVFNMVSMLLALAMIVHVRWVYTKGISALIKLRPNMWSLIAVGTGAAFIYSFIAHFMQQLFVSNVSLGLPPLYYEATTTIISLVLLGQLLETRSKHKSNSAVDALMNSLPKTVMRINADGTEYEVPIAHIIKGDLVRIREGETIGIDGIISSGSLSIDESVLSGEALPVEKKKGDKVIGGSICNSGSATLEVQAIGKNTRLSSLIKLVEKAQLTTPPIQKAVDKIAIFFVPAVFLVALASFVLWLVLAPQNGFGFAIQVMLSVLIIACPCSIGFATPISVTVSIGKAASKSMLIHTASAIETFAKVKVLFLDKTGTITNGKFSLVDIVLQDENKTKNKTKHEPEKVLAMAAILAKSSTHPLSKAIVETVKQKKIPIEEAPEKVQEEVQKLQHIHGKGVKALYKNRTLLMGNIGLIKDEKINSAFTEQHQKIEAYNAVYVAYDNLLLGVLLFSDTIKNDSVSSIQSLQKDMQVVLASGDTYASASKVAAQVGIKDIHAPVSPEDKLTLVKDYQKTNVVAMSGDGTNDAPALAQADVGIAMGSGTDIAMQSADITVMNSNLKAIVQAKKLSKATIKNIYQNLFFAFVYNTLGVVIATGVFFPFLGILLSPHIAALAMSLSSVSVISNALRLRRINL